MKIEKINVEETISQAHELLKKEKNISSALRAIFLVILTLMQVMLGRLSVNSKNSNKPPSGDPNRNKKKRTNSNRKPGGQVGRVGKNLKPVEDPDIIIPIKVDKRRLPKSSYYEVGFEARQIISIEISRVVTEYRAQILEDINGNRYVAPFPKEVSRPVQYGNSIKTHAVYLSQSQLIPYERVADYFINEVNIPISVGSLYNFNCEAYNLLEEFDALAKQKLIQAEVLHADETGINLNGKRIWLHNASNDQWTYFYPHEKRGAEAMNDIGILPNFRGKLIHDHWKPYYTFQNCIHGLCNAHHTRELEWVIENYPQYTWAKLMQDLLLEINKVVDKTDNQCLDDATADSYRNRYREIIQIGEREMPLNSLDLNQPKKKGRVKKTKKRNLLERLRDFEKDALLFMIDSHVPFTNNRGENDIRMTKVQQKISGCFKSIEGARFFCRIRSYLLTSQKHGLTHTEALKILFEGKLPDILFSE